MKLPLYIIVGLLGGGLAPASHAGPVQSIGWIEHVQLQPRNILLNAKIDTGADNSSLHADNIDVYEKKDGTKRVKFTVANKSGDSAEFDLPLVRYATIKRKGAEPLKRPIVNMALCMGNTLKSVNINLADRGNFKYRMLIGRSYLKDQYLVDAGKQYSIEPNCTGQPLAQKASS